MPSTPTQLDRPLTVTTPLGDDLLIVGLRGREAISEPFLFKLDFLAENETAIPFDRLLGRPVSTHLALLDGRVRHFSGICKSVLEGPRDPTYTVYRMEVVPAFWLLGRRAQSRIFQQESVPEILKRVLAGLDVAYEIPGTFHPRDYCVQYRETDLNFASRLMEEEGISYYFRHTASGHTMVVTNTPDGFARADPPSASYVGSEMGVHDEEQVFSWEKTQEVRSGKYALRDHCFETPDKSLEASQSAIDSVAVGAVTHKLRVAGNDALEIYDYPGGYAQRFDGVSPGGGDRSADLSNLFTDNTRTTSLRMEQESAEALTIRGAGRCRGMASGSVFRLENHFNADGPYLLTAVEHSADDHDAYRSGQGGEFRYENRFTCLPAGLPFRPRRATPKPTVRGTQTATVVGPAGEEIFTDKYGRVKVQFPWDREGKSNANSSCWVRVASLWAGSGWGTIQIPRIGQEVLVDFLEGDPDRPIAVGGVYNADQMPPYELPQHKTQSGIRSRSTLGGTPANFNELRFEDKRGSEQVYIQAEKDMDTLVKNNESLTVGSNRTKSVGNDETTTIGRNRSETVGENESVSIGRNQSISVGNDLSESVGGNASHTIGRTLTIQAGDMITIQCGLASIVLKKDGSMAIRVKSLSVSAASQINMAAAGTSKISLDPKGVSVEGLQVESKAQVLNELQGMVTKVMASGVLQTQGSITMMQ